MGFRNLPRPVSQDPDLRNPRSGREVPDEALPEVLQKVPNTSLPAASMPRSPSSSLRPVPGTPIELAVPSMSALGQDLRDAFRHLRSRPGFTTVVVLTLSMGIGLNAAVFTAVDAALLRSLPYAEPERLVHVFQDRGDMPRFELAWPTVKELQADRSFFSSVAGYNRAPSVWKNGGERSQLPSLRVTASFFDVLGVRPQLGRTFLPGEDVDGGPRAVILTNAFWRSQLGGDPAVLGHSMASPTARPDSFM